MQSGEFRKLRSRVEAVGRRERRGGSRFKPWSSGEGREFSLSQTGDTDTVRLGGRLFSRTRGWVDGWVGGWVGG